MVRCYKNTCLSRKKHRREGSGSNQGTSCMNDFHRVTRWISNNMSLDDFFNKYQHFYLTNQQNNNGQYLFYESPPMYNQNWQWEADPHNFQEETKLYNGIRAADLSELFSLLRLNNKTREILQN